MIFSNFVTIGVLCTIGALILPLQQFLNINSFLIIHFLNYKTIKNLKFKDFKK